jgi:hypothetical protein
MLELLFQLSFYFIVGVVSDILITKYMLCVAAEQPLASSIYSMMIAAFQAFVLYKIILSPDVIPHVISYSLGCGLSTYYIVKLSTKKKKK